MTKTPIVDRDLKLDIIEHVNDDHRKELLAIVQVYLSQQITQATLCDLYHEGMLLLTESPKGQHTQFVAFESQGDLHANVRHLAMQAQQRQQATTPTQWRFCVVDATQPTANMRRLVLQTDHAIPQNSPGYAWAFIINTQPELLRRYYTLRKAIQPPHTRHFLAYVDVYCHGDTPGTTWARELTVGDEVFADGEFYEHTAHLHVGQALLLADETALPTVAHILEGWQNPISPIVIIITHDNADQTYLNDITLPANSQVFMLNYEHGEKNIMACLEQIDTIDTVWGACEQHLAKTLRHYFRNQRKLTSTNNKMKGYWIKK